MAKPPIHPGNMGETLAGLLILLTLAAVAFAVYKRQFVFNPALHATVAAQTLPSSPSPETPPDSGWAPFLTDDLTPISPPEQFGPDNLSDKIDGKADLYLTSGFVALQSQRFARKDDRAAWMEVFVYDMGNVRQAFAVYSGQRREQSKDLDLGSFAYRTSDALFLVHGRYYVEITASASPEKLAADMDTFARRFAARTATDEEPIPELALLPRANRIEGSLILYLTNGFGFEEFGNLFAANYWAEGSELTAFFAVRPTAEEAARLAGAYAEFLLANGGEEESVFIRVPGARVVNLYGTYEVFFPHGGVLAGVHQAENKDAAERLALALYEEMTREDA